jgi:hypothetical protein
MVKTTASGSSMPPTARQMSSCKPVIAAHKRLLSVHSGKSAPFRQKAKVQ